MTTFKKAKRVFAASIVLLNFSIITPALFFAQPSIVFAAGMTTISAEQFTILKIPPGDFSIVPITADGVSWTVVYNPATGDAIIYPYKAGLLPSEEGRIILLAAWEKERNVLAQEATARVATKIETKIAPKPCITSHADIYVEKGKFQRVINELIKRGFTFKNGQWVGQDGQIYQGKIYTGGKFKIDPRSGREIYKGGDEILLEGTQRARDVVKRAEAMGFRTPKTEVTNPEVIEAQNRAAWRKIECRSGTTEITGEEARKIIGGASGGTQVPSIPKPPTLIRAVLSNVARLIGIDSVEGFVGSIIRGAKGGLWGAIHPLNIATIFATQYPEVMDEIDFSQSAIESEEKQFAGHTRRIAELSKQIRAYTEQPCVSEADFATVQNLVKFYFETFEKGLTSALWLDLKEKELYDYTDTIIGRLANKLSIDALLQKLDEELFGGEFGFTATTPLGKDIQTRSRAFVEAYADKWDSLALTICGTPPPPIICSRSEDPFVCPSDSGGTSPPTGVYTECTARGDYRCGADDPNISGNKLYVGNPNSGQGQPAYIDVSPQACGGTCLFSCENNTLTEFPSQFCGATRTETPRPSGAPTTIAQTNTRGGKMVPQVIEAVKLAARLLLK